MAKGVRFTANERAFIERKLICQEFDPKEDKLRRSVLEKLTASDQKPAGISVQAAVVAFRRYLGNRLVLPPNGAAGIYASMARRLAALGLNEEQCGTIAYRAGELWRGPVKVQSLINQAEVLLSTEQPEAKRDERPMEMDDL